MKKVEYTRANCPQVPTNYNKGQAVQWRVAYDLTGCAMKADNAKGCEGADVAGYQVKSPKASLIENDKCNGYIFGFVDSNYYYVMSNKEFETFASKFSYVDKDSATKKEKRRIRNDSKIMRDYLDQMAR